MNDDLHDAFARAADDAADQAMTADQIRRAATERIRARRRRRPAFVVGSAVAGLALVGGGAFAAVQLSGDDRGEIPDVIGSPAPTPQDSQTSEETEAPVTEAPSEEPSETPTEAPEPEQPAALPEADLTAVFPACGAVVEPTSGRQQLTFSPTWTEGAVGDTVTATFWNSSGDDLAGVASTHLTAVAVKDGVVVGWTEQSPEASTAPFDLDVRDFGQVQTTGALAHTLCTDGTTPLPAGRYSVWVAQQATVTERVPYDESYVAGAPVVTEEDMLVSGDVTSLWMDDAGRSVPSPGVAAGWPAQMSQDEAFRYSDAFQTIVWLAVSDREYLADIDPALYRPGTQVLDLGYLEPEVPFRCQPGADQALGVVGPDGGGSSGSGIGVIFATEAEAEQFVALWEPLHGPVTGVVTLAVGCDFS
ncbi:hypothetical protein Sked_32830 [Sanguibacter keddieii DSM 10542]|uniref:Uncharacterized protein n=1 Tax=Sanguibacter keddieii (strain ATCC 51767 / DSM 10542 / NCFB 3025 / ST-74) TaxID=446469 RepID=D1BDV7_SANKS|nr:hypothetical protein [Sanguibacter keddieii]ACZ23178.1 hypothetical protein Sked_32830 [Sanguibacter keddieii DSM 10542]